MRAEGIYRKHKSGNRLKKMGEAKTRVLVKEKIAESGIDLLRERFDVDVLTDMDQDQLTDQISKYDGIIIRSATQMTADVIEKADRLKVIGRAGIGLDNVDIDAATKRGIVVANAPESNMVAAAEHSMALMLAQCRNIPQAHESLMAGKWERSKFGGIEVFEKTLGVIGFGRIGQLVARRALGFGMTVIAYDPYVSTERYRELGVDRADSLDEVYERADIITLHLPKTPETVGIVNDESLAKMRDGVRIINVARGVLIDHDALNRALESGKVAAASLDVFPEEPCTDLPLFKLDNVVVTPHLGASTIEAQDRAGVITAEQVAAALESNMVSNAVNIPSIGADDMEILSPFIELCKNLGRLGTALASSTSIDHIGVEMRGDIAAHDTRILTLSVLQGAFMGRVEENVNLVNAEAIAEKRGIGTSELKDAESFDFTDLVLVKVKSDGSTVTVGGTTFGPKHLPHLVYAYGQSFNIQLAEHMAFFRYVDQPGMVGRIGTILGEHEINIASTAVGRDHDADLGEGEGGGNKRLAAMALTVDTELPDDVLKQITDLEGFREGRAVTL